jgi:Domain of unknown function (DUF1707)
VPTANTRATDSDRNDTCQVLDAALGEGQLSMEEHRQRVSAATKATTLGELQSLVSDLQIHRPPVQLPTLTAPLKRRAILIAGAVVLVLSGAGVAGALIGSSSPSKTDTTATPAANSPPSTSTSAPAPAPPDLLSLGGLTGFLAQVQKQFGDTLGYELTVWPERAVLVRPDAVNAHKTVSWYYVNGGWMNLGPAAMPVSTSVGDLSKFDVQEVLGVLRGAPQTLNIKNPTRTYLTIESAKDGSLALTIHLSDDTTGGHIVLAADGSVQQIAPAHP